MPIELITGPANAGKAHAVLRSVRAHLARGREPWLVVPTEADQARYRRELVEGGATLGVRVERFEGLLSEIVRKAGHGEAVLGPFARERALAAIAKEVLDEERVFAGLARALASLIAELEVARVSPARLRDAIEAWPSAPPFAAGLCEAFASYRDLLASMRRVDREGRAMRSLDALRRDPSLWGEIPVALYGFDSFTELELDAIETLGSVVDADLTVSLTFEPGRFVFAGRAEAFERLRPLARAHTPLAAQDEHYAPGSRGALHHLERFLLEEDTQRADPGQAVRLLEGASPRAEAELIAGEIRALIDDGVKPEEIAIVHRAPESVAGLLAEVFEDFEVPHSVGPQARVGTTALGRALVGLMRCACPDGRLSDLLAWLRAPGVLDRPELADRLEAMALRRGAVSAAAARALWEADHWPLDRIDRVAAAAGVAAAGIGPEAEAGAAAGVGAAPAAPKASRRLLAVLLDELERLFRAPRRQAAALLAERELAEAQALTAIRRALEELDDLARAAPHCLPCLDELADLLAGLPLPARQRPPAGQVVLSDPLSLRARRVRALFLCGLQEGVFPAPAASRPLLGDEARRELAQCSGLALARERDPLAAERYLLYATCSRPEERLFLTWHSFEEDGSPAAPSLFLDDVCDLFYERLRTGAAHRAAASVAWPGPGTPAGVAASRAAALAEGSGACEPTIAPLRDPAVLDEMRSRTLWSASSLEALAACPVRWMVERLLSVECLEGDGEPLARGALAHAVLKDVLQRLRSEAGSARVTQASLGTAKRLLAEALLQRAPEHLGGLSPERRAPLRRRLQADLERYLEHLACEESPLEPTHFELEFGFDPGRDGQSRGSAPGERPPPVEGPAPAEALPPLELADGVSIRGRIDRVDVGPGGETVVYDYKTSVATPGAKWAESGSLQVALYMQAVERLLGGRAVGGFYQPLSGRDLRARGVLDAGAGVELDCVRTDNLDREELTETLAACREAALAAVEQARAGVLEPRPATCGYGGAGCAYPEICRC